MTCRVSAGTRTADAGFLFGPCRGSARLDRGMIDAHIHVVPPRLPGVGPLSPRLNGPPEAVAAELRGQMEEAGVTHALAMGCWRGGDDDPLGVTATLRLAARVPGLHAIGCADPTRVDADHLRRAEEALATGRVRALTG